MENWEREWVDYYLLLGLLPTADSETVIAVYRRLARKYGVPGGSDPDEAKFRLLNEAHEVLTDPAKRARYDSYRTHRANASGKARSEQPSALSHDLESRSQQGPEERLGQRFVVRVMNRQSVKSMLLDSGLPYGHRFLTNNGTWLDDAIRLGPKSGETSLRYFSSKAEPYAKLLSEIDSAGYRPADLAESLGFVKDFPAEQMVTPVWSFISCKNGLRLGLYFSSTGQSRAWSVRVPKDYDQWGRKFPHNVLVAKSTEKTLQLFL